MKKSTATAAQPADTPLSDWSLRLWFAAALLLGLIISIIGTAWAVRHAIADGPLLSGALKRGIITVAKFPGFVKTVVHQLPSRFKGDPLLLLMDRKTTETSHWVRRFPAPEDSGYLLFSGVDPVAKHSNVQLIRISDGAIIARWDPDWPAVVSRHTTKKYSPQFDPKTIHASHPLLLADGDIIFATSSNTLVRMSPCSRQPVWILDELIHHSIELDETSGTAIWAPSVSQDGLADNLWLRDRVRDDSLALVSFDGRLIENRSFARILRDNGLQAILLGAFGSRLNEDPIHMNQIKIASRDSRHWRRGDLLISARHLSTVFLYRPSTGKILWHQTGPWMNQHSADFVDDHRISVFDNNIVSAVPEAHAFMSHEDINRVILYDFDTKQVSQPFKDMLAEARPVTISGGLARVLPDGGLFIEETNYGRHLRFTRDKLLWSRVNDYDDKRIGLVSWSRYLTADEARVPLQALTARHCSANAAAVN